MNSILKKAEHVLAWKKKTEKSFFLLLAKFGLICERQKPYENYHQRKWKFVEYFSIEESWAASSFLLKPSKVMLVVLGGTSFLLKPSKVMCILRSIGFLLKPSQAMLTGSTLSLLSGFFLQTGHLFTYTLAPSGPGFHVPLPLLCFFHTRVCVQLTQKDSWPISEPNVRQRNRKCHLASSGLTSFLGLAWTLPNHVVRNMKLQRSSKGSQEGKLLPKMHLSISGFPQCMVQTVPLFTSPRTVKWSLAEELELARLCGSSREENVAILQCHCNPHIEHASRFFQYTSPTLAPVRDTSEKCVAAFFSDFRKFGVLIKETCV